MLSAKGLGFWDEGLGFRGLDWMGVEAFKQSYEYQESSLVTDFML